MHPLVFSPEWFVRHQRVLLGLLRVPVIGRELRDVLAIRRCDVGYDGRIVALFPHAYVVANPDGTYTLDCRTHAKYAKRLRHQLAPLWRAAHEWDRFVANPLVLALNVGFDTLIVRTDPDPGVTTCDGWVYVSGVDLSFAAIRAASATTVQTNNGAIYPYLGASAITNQFTQLTRTFFGFDLAGFAGSYVPGATFSLYGESVGNGLGGGASLHVAAATPASNTTLALSDFANVGSTSFGSITLTAWNSAGYNDIVFNAAGAAALVAGQVFKICNLLDWDLNGSFTGTWISGGSAWAWADAADQTGSSFDPKLTVTWSGRGGFPYAHLGRSGMSISDQRWPS